MVMGAVAVISVMLAEMQDESSAEQASAVADRDAVQAEYLARSAVALSRLLVAAEPTMRMAIAPLFMLMQRTAPQLPVWEFADRILGAFNDSESAGAFTRTTGLDLSAAKNLGLEGGSFEVRIIDEDSKINVNGGGANAISHRRLAQQLMGLMAPPQFSPMFEQRDAQGQFSDRMAICSALIDWADLDEQFFSCDGTATASGGGAEDGYYTLLKKPYRRKNAPYDSLEELRMVRGVGDDFWATFVEPDPQRPDKRVLTVWGQGTVNVNSANAQTLLGLVCAGAPEAELCVDPIQSAAFLSGVTMAKAMTMGAPMFGSKDDFIATLEGKGMLGPLLATLGVKPVRFKAPGEFKAMLSTESKIFSIYAVGVVRGYKREVRTQIHAVVDFRSAPALAAAAMGAAGGTTAATTAGATTGGSTAAGGTIPGLPAGATADGILGALRPSSGGNILHYKVQ
jgi:general secretion pathway protein K